jgi:hypothetical protein
MFELHIATVLVDGSEHEIALSVASLIEFEKLHTVSIIKAVDENLSMEYLVTLSYLSMKQNGHVSNIEKYKSEVKGVSYRVERIPFGVTASTESSPD